MVQLLLHTFGNMLVYLYMYLSLLQKQRRFKGAGWQCGDVKMLHPNLLFQMLCNRSRQYIIYVNNLISKRY